MLRFSLCFFWYMAWPSAWGNKETKEKHQLAILEHQRVENLQLNIFQWNTCNFTGTFAIEKSWNASCQNSLSESFCFVLTILLHLVWLSAFYKSLNQNESNRCCWNNIVREWPNTQLLLVISREIPPFEAFSSIFSMFFKMSEFPSGIWIPVYPLPQIPQTVHQVS